MEIFFGHDGPDDVDQLHLRNSMVVKWRKSDIWLVSCGSKD